MAAKPTSAFKRYMGVAPGSRIEVDIDPCDGKTQGEASLFRAERIDRWFPCIDRVPEHSLDAGRHYFVAVQLSFVGETTSVRVVVRVVGPAGTVHSNPWTWKITGKDGDVAVVGGFIEAEKASS